MTDKLEDLEKQFISDGDMEQEEISKLITKTLTFARIDKNGFVSLLNPLKIKIADKIMLVLISRYLANKLQTKLGKEVSINENMKIDDLANNLREKRAVIIARIKDLKDNNLISSDKEGIYRIQPHAISPFLDRLNKENEKNGN
jgi:hypothetical protein